MRKCVFFPYIIAFIGLNQEEKKENMFVFSLTEQRKTTCRDAIDFSKISRFFSTIVIRKEVDAFHIISLILTFKLSLMIRF
jgi:hypothetical protein